MKAKSGKVNPFEGKEIRMGEGIVYEPKCKSCNEEGFGFHIVDAGERFDKRDVEGCCCPECGSDKVEWLPAGYSAGKVIMKKGWKAKK